MSPQVELFMVLRSLGEGKCISRSEMSTFDWAYCPPIANSSSRSAGVVAGRFVSWPNLNVLALDTDLEGIDAESRVIGPHAIGDAEPPGMPRAGDRPLGIEMPGPQGSAHVGANVIDRVVTPTLKKEGDQPIGHLERSTFPLGNIAHFGNGDEVVIRGFFVRHDP